MPKPRVDAAGGLAALAYTLKKGREAGGVLRLYARLRSRNACKTCAYGMGGQAGGMANEHRSFPEVCKKSIQAQAGDMQRPIPPEFWERHSVEELSRWTSMRLEYAGRLTRPVAWREGDTHFRPIAWGEALDRVAPRTTPGAPPPVGTCRSRSCATGAGPGRNCWSGRGGRPTSARWSARTTRRWRPR